MDIPNLYFDSILQKIHKETMYIDDAYNNDILYTYVYMYIIILK